MIRFLATLIALALLYLCVNLGALHRDSPGQRLLQTLQEEGHRCLVCNYRAIQKRDYFLSSKSEGIATPHYFCTEHAPPAQVWYMFWPEVDKYLFLVSALVMHVGACFALLKSIFGSSLDSPMAGCLGGAMLIGFAYYANQVMAICNAA